MPRRPLLLPSILLTLAALTSVGALAQPDPWNTNGGSGRDRLGGAAYGGATYGGATYGGATYGGATYGGATYDSPPSIMVVTRDEVMRIDDGARRILMTKPDPDHAYQPILVDQATGQWALSHQAQAFPGDNTGEWLLIVGGHNGPREERNGDPGCRQRKLTCFEEPFGFASDGGVLTRSLTRKGTSIGHYARERGPRVQLADRAIGTVFAISPDQHRAAYASRKGLFIVPWSDIGVPARTRPTRVRLTGAVNALTMTGDSLYFLRAVGRRQTFERYDLATGRRHTLGSAEHAIAGWAMLPVPGRDRVLAHVCTGDPAVANRCDVVELSSTGVRTVVRGVVYAHDVSLDGRYLLARRQAAPSAPRSTAWPDLVVIDLATGATVQTEVELDVESARFTRRAPRAIF